jgi:hypothetical protein
MESGNQESIVTLEKKITGSTVNDDQQAYLGAILMKTSEFQKTAGDKLKKFKEGKTLLEKAIQTHPNNVEYRFLRLMIQENSPKILKYNTNLKEDVAFIKDNISKVSKEIKTVIISYSAVSENLKFN